MIGLVRFGLFGGVLLGITCKLSAEGFAVLDGQLSTNLEVTCVQCTATEGDGARTIFVVPEVSSYSISRNGVATYPEGIKYDAASADLEFSHSSTAFTLHGDVGGVAFDQNQEFEGTAGLSGIVKFELTTTELVRIEYPIERNANSEVRLVSVGGSDLFECLTFGSFGGGCSSSSPLFLDGGQYELTFSASTFREVGHELPGELQFSLAIVPEPTTLFLFLGALVACVHPLRRRFPSGSAILTDTHLA